MGAIFIISVQSRMESQKKKKQNKIKNQPTDHKGRKTETWVRLKIFFPIIFVLHVLLIVHKEFTLLPWCTFFFFNSGPNIQTKLLASDNMQKHLPYIKHTSQNIICFPIQKYLVRILCNLYFLTTQEASHGLQTCFLPELYQVKLVL